MNNYLKGLCVLVAVAVLWVGYKTLTRPPVVERVVERISEPSNYEPGGALTGPEISSPYLKWGGILLYNSKPPFQTATTTLCSVANPFGATTTFRSITASITTATGTAAVLVFATSTNAFATSSTDKIVDRDFNLAANEARAFTYHPAGLNDNLVGPSEKILFQSASPGLGGYTFGGSCSVVWEKL